MYDVHSHILPGLDDGAKTVDEFVAMARAAAAGGTTVMLATPHRRDVTEDFSIPYLRELFANMVEELDARGIGLTLTLGMENHLDPDLPEALARGAALPMNATRYALVELPFFGHPDWVEPALSDIQASDITPVLAHPERIELVQRDPDVLRAFVERGMLTQVTAGSLTGQWGDEVKRFTHALLRRGLVHMLASDTHAPGGPRSPALLPGMKAAAEIVGAERAQAMVLDTPRAVIEGREVVTAQGCCHEHGPCLAAP